MEKNIKKLKKLIEGEEFTLLEMDNEVQEILSTNSSIFEGNTEEFVWLGQHVYTVEEKEEFKKITKGDIYVNVIFEVIKKEKDNLETVVKVIEIETL